MGRITPVLIALLLAGCGGSGSNDDSADNNPVIDSTALARCSAVTPLQTVSQGALVFYLQPQYITGQQSSIVAGLSSQQSHGYHFSWQQTSGTPLPLSVTDQPVLPFETAVAGDYGFSVTVSGNNQHYQADIAITVSQDSGLSLRLDHALVEGADASLRLDRPNGNLAQNVSWCVAQGPDIHISSDSDEQLLFSAPQVTQDTLLVVRATGLVDGVSQSDDVNLLITNEATINSAYFDTPVARTHSYRQDSPWADVLQPCVYSNQLRSSCTLSALPLIGQETADNHIDKAAIMNRVLVSHDWMGQNFEAFLDTLDTHSDFAKLLQSVTAIVISYDVRPSFYWVVTGAIYLDPEDLWLSASERDTINEAPDYRSAYGEDLQFLVPWRYVKNNDYASVYRNPVLRQSRTLTELAPDLASLLYHELAHANDYFPRSIHGSLSGPTLLDDYSRRSSAKALGSDQLSNQLPLQSAEMQALASVRFHGSSASAVQKAYLPDDVAGFFSPDSANDFYNYSTSREDAAMLFEEAMMSYRLGIQRDVAITDKPAQVSASTVTVSWGQRGRIAKDSIQPRAAMIIDYIMPEINGAALEASLPTPLPMRSGESWLANLNLTDNAKPATQRILPLSSATPPLRLSGERHVAPQH
ncbi:PKD domain-containing protein [Shewanella sp. YIC-542]|uniref:PKD domain-containing protein n=1 Tax=Shewanella mytili TaxID=3377111 RepID=UPI00398E43ED